MTEPRVLRTVEAAKHLGLKPSTLEKMRARGTGPRFVRLGRRAVGYTREDLDAWIEDRLSTAAADDERR